MCGRSNIVGLALEVVAPMRWFKIGRETDFGETGKAFMGIGPDGIRMTRGTTMPWPYEKRNGEINDAYRSFVNLLEIERMTENALNAWMDDLMNDRIPFPTIEEFLAKFNDPKYSAIVIKRFAENITVLLIQKLKRVNALNHGGSHGKFNDAGRNRLPEV